MACPVGPRPWQEHGASPPPVPALLQGTDTLPQPHRPCKPGGGAAWTVLGGLAATPWALRSQGCAVRGLDVAVGTLRSPGCSREARGELLPCPRVSGCRCRASCQSQPGQWGAPCSCTAGWRGAFTLPEHTGEQGACLWLSQRSSSRASAAECRIMPLSSRCCFQFET